MSKSKYPSKLDTSVEIPVIRDNITEIGSDVLNSLRSAIFNIEKTLGINPQGATGNTVASRLNNALDSNGNITKDALDRSNVLSGPISNEDISKSAGIDEEKLHLNFPTQLLQDQISILDHRIALFIKSLEELNAILSAHIHPDATNRHYAKAISVESDEGVPSNAATTSLQEGTLQEVLEEVYNAHINFTGEGVASDNNSHNASQIYYNNLETSDIISAQDVQGAIDDIAGLQGKSLTDSTLNLNSNGIIRTGSIIDAYEQNEIGSLLVSESEISYAGPDGNSKQLISFLDKPMPAAVIKPFDILTIVDSPNEHDNRDYLVESVTLEAGGELRSVVVFGGPKYALEVGTTAKISKSIYSNYNENGLNSAARPRYMRSNTPDVQVANPNAATIISSGIRATNIVNSSTNILAIEIDGESNEIDIFNEDVAVQTIDTIVEKINSYFVANRSNAFAYKLRALRCYELAITHILPNSLEDVANRTLKIVAASENDAHDSLGLGYILDREIEGKAGNTCHINGKLITSFGSIKKYSGASIIANPGTTSLIASGVNFFNEGIREGDLCTIYGASNDSDNGTYRVYSVEDSTIILDSTGFTFSAGLEEESAVFIQRCTAPVGELEFEELDGLTIIDVFMTDTGDINFKRRADIQGHLQDASFYATVTDFSRGFIVDEQKYGVQVDTDGYAKLVTLPGAVEEGPEVFVGITGRYKIMSPDLFNYVILDVQALGPPSLAQEVEITGRTEISRDVFHLSRITYSTMLGFIMGSPSDSGGSIPVVIDKRTTGTVDDTIISENILERYIQGPRNELRGSGIIRDLDIKSVDDDGDGTCRVTINPGVGVINGVRVEYLGIRNKRYNYSDPDTSNFYVAIDGKGCLLMEAEIEVDGEYISPFFSKNVAHIAYIEVLTGVSITITDLRLFVDHLDYKVIADITVANDQKFGHFTDIKKAVDYARKFTKMFPDMGTPSITIKEGMHIVRETIIIDFDLKISGTGPQTIIKRGGNLLNGNAVHPSLVPTFMIGGGTPDAAVYSASIKNGVSMGDFSYFVSPELNEFGVAILLAQPVTEATYGGQFFSFDKIRFQAKLAPRKEFAIVIGPDNPIGETYGNATISNCFFDWMGSNTEPCYLNNGNAFSNIVVSGNIATNVWGSTGVKSGLNLGIVWVLDPVTTNYADPYIENFSEIGNQSDDQE